MAKPFKPYPGLVKNSTGYEPMSFSSREEMESVFSAIARHYGASLVERDARPIFVIPLLAESRSRTMRNADMRYVAVAVTMSSLLHRNGSQVYRITLKGGLSYEGMFKLISECYPDGGWLE